MNSLPSSTQTDVSDDDDAESDYENSLGDSDDAVHPRTSSTHQPEHLCKKRKLFI